MEKTKSNQAAKFNEFIKNHSDGNTIVIDSIEKWRALYDWHGKEIQFRVLKDHRLELLTLFTYKGKYAKNITYKDWVSQSIKDITSKASELEEKVKNAEIRIRYLEMKVKELEEKQKRNESDIFILKEIHQKISSDVARLKSYHN
ncbi:hypothetical protein EI74_0576 [Mycoplasma testudineum]|uniref:Uncharacterized protein n=1 Tax=Mycoplasma testudineum TaxID=244584 RepID=A0A4R6IC13_9MOLU|nr:hypothetical protein [Mycoplasma testudineum]OYD26645.1 hypothetical protein CG473_02480 [Mycoplasma testudineum]TDO19773.1 hypothetical protein EI74_0576 [Mycoplasma testudineum]